MSTYKFGNFEIEIDVTDVGFIEKYESVLEEYEKDIAKLPKDGKASETMRYVCGAFFKAFDNLFGEDTHLKMFGEKWSADLCVVAFQELVQVAKDYSKTLEKMHLPVKANRAQRRAKK